MAGRERPCEAFPRRGCGGFLLRHAMERPLRPRTSVTLERGFPSAAETGQAWPGNTKAACAAATGKQEGRRRPRECFPGSAGSRAVSSCRSSARCGRGRPPRVVLGDGGEQRCGSAAVPPAYAELSSGFPCSFSARRVRAGAVRQCRRAPYRAKAGRGLPQPGQTAGSPGSAVKLIPLHCSR